MNQFTQQEIDEMLRLGIDPNKVSLVGETPPPAKPTPGQRIAGGLMDAAISASPQGSLLEKLLPDRNTPAAFGINAVDALPAGAAGLATLPAAKVLLGGLAKAPGIPGIIGKAGMIAVPMVGAMAGEQVKELILDEALPNVSSGYQEKRDTLRQTNPIGSFTGGTAGGVAGGGLNPFRIAPIAKTIQDIASKKVAQGALYGNRGLPLEQASVNALANAAVGAPIGAGTDIAQQVIQQREANPELGYIEALGNVNVPQVLGSAAANALFTSPTKAGLKFGLAPDVPFRPDEIKRADSIINREQARAAKTQPEFTKIADEVAYEAQRREALNKKFIEEQKKIERNPIEKEAQNIAAKLQNESAQLDKQLELAGLRYEIKQKADRLKAIDEELKKGTEKAQEKRVKADLIESPTREVEGPTGKTVVPVLEKTPGVEKSYAPTETGDIKLTTKPALAPETQQKPGEATPKLAEAGDIDLQNRVLVEEAVADVNKTKESVAVKLPFEEKRRVGFKGNQPVAERPERSPYGEAKEFIPVRAEQPETLVTEKPAPVEAPIKLSTETPTPEQLAKNAEDSRRFQKDVETRRKTTPTLVRFFDDLARRRATRLEEDTTLPARGAMPSDADVQQAYKEGKEIVGKINPNRETADTRPHELTHGFLSWLKASPHKTDNAIAVKVEKAIADSPEYRDWARREKELDSTNDASVDEFIASENGIETLRRLSSQKQGREALRDFWSHLKLRFNRGNPKDVMRIMSSKLLFDNPAPAPKTTDKVAGRGTIRMQKGGDQNAEEVQKQGRSAVKFDEMRRAVDEAKPAGRTPVQQELPLEGDAAKFAEMRRATELPRQQKDTEPYYSRMYRAIEALDTQGKKSMTGYEWLPRIKNLAEKRGQFKMREFTDADVESFLKSKGTFTKDEILSYIKDKISGERDILLSDETAIRAVGSDVEEVTRGLTDRFAIVVADDNSAPYGDAYHYGKPKRQISNKQNDRLLQLEEDIWREDDPLRQAALRDEYYSLQDEWMKPEAGTISFAEAGMGRTVDGKPIMVIDQMQSPRHQAGKDEGYSNELPVEKIKATRERLISELEYYKENIKRAESRSAYPPMEGAEKAALRDMRAQVTYLEKVLNYSDKDFATEYALTKSNVPPAPYKDIRDWVRRGIKSILRKAADTGVKKIGWATGRSEAEYAGNLDQVYYAKADGRERAKYFRKKGLPVNDELPLYTTRSGEEYFTGTYEDIANSPDGGRGLANTVRDKANEGWQSAEVGLEGTVQELVYDKVMRQELNKYAEEMGWPSRVGEDEVRIKADPFANDIFKDEASARAFIKSRPDLKNAKVELVNNGQNAIVKWDMPGTKVYSFDLTPEMVDQINNEGQPRYQRDDGSTPTGQELTEPLQHRGVWRIFRNKAITSGADRIADLSGQSPTGVHVSGQLKKYAQSVTDNAGKYVNSPMEIIEQYHPEEIANVYESLLNERYNKKVSDEGLTSSEIALKKELREGWYAPIKDDANAVGIRVGGREGRKDPTAWPLMMSGDAMYQMTGHGTKRETYKNMWKEYLVKQDGFADEARTEGFENPTEYAKKLIDDYLGALTTENVNSVEFNALTKMEGWGAPRELVEKNLLNLVRRYGDRTARHIAFAKYLAGDKVTAKALELTQPDGTKASDDVTNLDGSEVEKLISLDEVKPILNSFVYSKHLKDSKTFRAFTRAYNSHIMGPLTGIKNWATSPIVAAKYMGIKDIPAAIKGFTNYSKNISEAFTAGAYRKNPNEIWMGSSENPNMIVDALDRWSTVVSKYQGSRLLENSNRIWLYGAGEAATISNFQRAMNGDTKAIEWLKKFGDTVDNLDELIGKGVDEIPREAISKIAKGFVEKVQGSYDVRGLSQFVSDSNIAPFFHLSRWSIEQMNHLYNDAIVPARKGDYGPLLKTLLATSLGGAAIQQLTQMVNGGKKAQEATMDEAMTSGDSMEIGAALASRIQAGAALGFYGDIINTAMKAATGKGGRLPIGIPLWDYVSGQILPATAALADAIDAGEDKLPAVMKYVDDVMLSTFQAYRLIAANLWKAKDIKRQNAYRDYNVWKDLIGENEKPNPQRYFNYKNLDQKEMKQNPEFDLEGIQKTVGKTVEKNLRSEKPDITKLLDMKQDIQAMKGNSYQTFPDPVKRPDKFMAYYEHLTKTQGEEAANAAFEAYISQRIVNKMKNIAIDPMFKSELLRQLQTQ